jgi:hypothetical protein
MKLPLILAILLAILSVFRLSYMFAQEDGPFGIFVRMREYFGRAVVIGIETGRLVYDTNWTVAELVNCPHCIGLYLSILFSFFVIFPTTVGNVILIILGVAGAQSFLTHLIERE